MSVFDSPFNQVFRNPYGSAFNAGAGTWTPALWFLASEQGVWYDIYDPLSIGAPARTNLLTYSEDLTHLAWDRNYQGVTRTLTGDLTPTGAAVNKLSETAVTDTHRIGYALANAGKLGVVRRFSVQAKAAERTLLRGWSWSGGSTSQQTFDLIAGTCSGDLNPSMTALGSGWWLCSFDVPALNGDSVVIGPSDGTMGTGSYLGTTGSGILVSAAQLSVGTAAYQKVTDWAVEYCSTASPTSLAMFQDSAGTTPVTAVEQPVGLVLDKRLGLVRGAELVTNGGFDTDTWWSKGGEWIISGGVASRTSGTLSCDLFRNALLTVGKVYEVSLDIISVSGTLSVFAGGSGAAASFTTAGTKTMRLACAGDANFYIKAVTTTTVTIDNISVRELPGNHASQATTAQKPVLSARRNKLLATATLATQSVTLTASAHTLSFKGTGTVTLTGASTAGPLVGTGAGNRVSLTFTPTAGSVTFTVSGSVTEAQLEDGSAFTTYQSVVTATNYDTVGFPHYLKFDGVDDSLATAAIDFTATDKMTVVAGVRNLATSGYSVLAELSSNFDTNTGAFTFGTASAHIGGSRGSVLTTTTSSAFVVGTDYVLSMAADISGDSLALRRNGTAASSSAADQGTGNFGNYPLYIGRRGGTSFPFNGYIYSLTVRGAATADLTPAETYTAGKTGITL